MLFPEAPEGASKAAITRAENVRADARAAARMPINKVGNGAGNLATLWNAATYLVDRNADGSARTHGDSDRLDSLLFGGRAERLAEINKLVEVVMADGSIERMTVPQATDHGLDAASIARQVMADLMD